VKDEPFIFYPDTPAHPCRIKSGVCARNRASLPMSSRRRRKC
jgi:hypothetical protein